jgi:hypothetical protein
MRGLGGPPSTASRSGSGSEIYERLPDSGSVADELDDGSFEDRLRMSGSDESDDPYIESVERNCRSFQQQQESVVEHLVKPSQIKNKKKQQGKKTYDCNKYTFKSARPAGHSLTTQFPDY